jgi:hypothetical protein
MAAGQGFKTFITGEVLTAGDVNGYLMQGINVFATTTARDAAITAPAEGQFAFTKDTNSLWYYDGAAWVASGAAGDIEGVTAGVGISGGGTSGTVTITNSMATAIDAKGDLVAGTGADTFSRLAVGANGTVLTADSAEATGLKWAAASGGSETWSLLNAGGTNLSGSATVTVSGISGKTRIMVVITDASSGSASSTIGLQLNTDTSSIYSQWGNIIERYGTYGTGNFYGESVPNNPYFVLGQMSNDATSKVHSATLLSNCNSTSYKIAQIAGGVIGSGNGGTVPTWNGFYTGSSAVSSVSIYSNTGNFDGGKVFVYAA